MPLNRWDVSHVVGIHPEPTKVATTSGPPTPNFFVGTDSVGVSLPISTHENGSYHASPRDAAGVGRYHASPRDAAGGVHRNTDTSYGDALLHTGLDTQPLVG